MILAAGLTPAWQQIVLLDALRIGEVNRAREVHWCASGKVLNVGIALHHLSRSCSTKTPPPKPLPVGETSDPLISNVRAKTLALVGGPARIAIEREFTDLGADFRWVISEIPTRVCTTILDQSTATTTELVENSGTIPAAELDEFQRLYVEEAASADIVVLTGSLPAGAPVTFYRDLFARTPGRAILDARGDALLAALEQKPFVVKPNREELGQTLNSSLSTDAELHAAMKELNRRGAEWVVVSQGKESLWVSSATKRFRMEPPRVTVVNPIGSGDCLAAGIAWALAAGVPMPDAVRYGLAAASENVGQLLPARLDPVRVSALAETIELRTQ